MYVCELNLISKKSKRLEPVLGPIWSWPVILDPLANISENNYNNQYRNKKIHKPETIGYR